MPVTITIDVFSGRPNPSVVVDGPEADELLERLRPTRDARRNETAPFAESGLGYRGIIIHAGDKRPRGIPAEFRVVHGIGIAEKTSFAVADEGFEDFVCGSTGPFRPVLGDEPKAPGLPQAGASPVLRVLGGLACPTEGALARPSGMRLWSALRAAVVERAPPTALQQLLQLRDERPDEHVRATGPRGGRDVLGPHVCVRHAGGGRRRADRQPRGGQ